MKRNAIARLIVYSLVALVLTGILVTGILGNGFVFHISESHGTVVQNEAHVEATPGIDLEINWVAGHVTIKRENVDRIYFRETADGEIKRPMTYHYEGDTLELNHSRSSVFFGFNKVQEKNLVVVVPMDWNCGELSIDGADLTIDVMDLAAREVSIDGAGTYLNFHGNVDQVEINGAGCEIQLSCQNKPQSISIDGAGCVLSLTLPENCGFQVEMDGLGCEFSTELSCSKHEGIYFSGDGYCQIEVSGMGCEVTILEAEPGDAAYKVQCGDDFTASLLLETPEGEYTPGTIIRLKTGILTDVDLELYVNGRFVCKQMEAFSSDGTNYWEFYFTMPDEAAIIQFKTVDGILR